MVSLLSKAIHQIWPQTCAACHDFERSPLPEWTSHTAPGCIQQPHPLQNLIIFMPLFSRDSLRPSLTDSFGGWTGAPWLERMVAEKYLPRQQPPNWIDPGHPLSVLQTHHPGPGRPHPQCGGRVQMGHSCSAGQPVPETGLLL